MSIKVKINGGHPILIRGSGRLPIECVDEGYLVNTLLNVRTRARFGEFNVFFEEFGHQNI